MLCNLHQIEFSFREVTLKVLVPYLMTSCEKNSISLLNFVFQKF